MTFRFSPAGSAVLGLTLIMAATVPASSGAAPTDPAPTAGTRSGTPATKSLSRYRDTYWYVPKKYLLAYKYESGPPATVRPATDQTVWHFTKARHGFLFGCSYQGIDQGPWSPSKIIGSVTPDNRVLIGFYSSIDVAGSGTLVESGRRSYFLMQVSTGPRANGITHWAYMAEAKPGSRAWKRLPGTGGQSIPSVDTGC